MRPLKLTITGLQSFRETQTIDFKTLTSGGVFGIFGPTGSGKSTILDAITLALYNKVERALRGTHGIMNHSVDRMGVEFTFALGQHSHERMFRVERNFTRGNNDSLNTAQCRLVELLPPEGEEIKAVLADRVREIDEKIQMIIGLTVDDFTRAVVLPQNRFAEFLSLKGKDRRAMLERIFNLNQYGQNLNQVVSDRQKIWERELEGLLGQQKSLEGASKEAVTEAKSLCDQAVAKEKEIRTEKEKREKIHETKQRRWEEQKRLEALEQELENLLPREATIIDQERVLEKALKAEPLRPYLTSYNEALTKKKQREEAFSRVQTQWNGAQGTYEEAKERLQTARKDWEEKEPHLKNQQYQLEQAVILEERALKLEAEIEIRTGTLETAREEKKGLEEALQEKENKRKELDTEKTNLQKKIQEIQVNPQYRQLIHNAHAALKDYEQALNLEKTTNEKYVTQEKGLAQNQKDLQEAIHKEQEAGDNKEAQEKDLSTWDTKKPISESELHEIREQLWQNTALFDTLGQNEKELQKIQGEYDALEQEIEQIGTAKEEVQEQLQEKEQNIQDLKKRYTLLEETLRDLETQEKAAILARELQGGQPCPVCGSKEHPQPATGQLAQTITETEEALKEAKQHLETQEKEQQRLAFDVNAFAIGIDNLKKDIQHRLDTMDEKEKIIQSCRRKLPEPMQTLSLQEIEGQLQQEEKRVQVLNRDLNDWQEIREQKTKELEKAREHLSRCSNERQTLETLQQEKQKNLEAIAKEYKEQKEILKAREMSLEEARGSIPVETIEEEVQTIKAKDQEFQALCQERDTLEEELKSLDTLLKQTHEKLDKARGKVQKEEHDVASIQTEKRQLQDDITERTGGLPAKQTLQDVEEQIKNLKTQWEAAEKMEQNARLAYDEAHKKYVQAQSDLENAQQQTQKSHLDLEKKVSEHNFTTSGEAEDALLTDKERLSLQENINSFREQEKELHREKKKLLESLGDERLSPREWERWNEELVAIKEEYEASLTQMVEAQQTYKSRQKNFSRWQELEKERQSLETRKGRLDELKQLLRGNAFVEFMATEKLQRIARVASERLYNLTNNRYALETEGHEGFMIRDDANGGVRRPVSSLSGGETFLTSLALALALSAQIQLKGKYNLEFFFLDEGFGSLDPEALELALNTLEHLQLEKFQVGVISHVPEIRTRLPYRLLIEPPEPAGPGSRIKLERA